MNQRNWIQRLGAWLNSHYPPPPPDLEAYLRQNYSNLGLTCSGTDILGSTRYMYQDSDYKFEFNIGCESSSEFAVHVTVHSPGTKKLFISKILTPYRLQYPEGERKLHYLNINAIQGKDT